MSLISAIVYILTINSCVDVHLQLDRILFFSMLTFSGIVQLSMGHTQNATQRTAGGALCKRPDTAQRTSSKIKYERRLKHLFRQTSTSVSNTLTQFEFIYSQICLFAEIKRINRFSDLILPTVR